MPDEKSARIEFILLADRADVSEGKLYVMGGCWDRIAIPRIGPDARVEVGVALRVLVPEGVDDVQHRIELRVHGPGSPTITPNQFTFIRNPQKSDLPGSLPVLIARQCSVGVNAAGLHTIEAVVDDESSAEARFQLVVGKSD